ncbi:hypothetical protein ONS95_003785 [Cadophora gregata]|uniref:uncharacterized protein n=1 Tax=Cadophora gregata TaxID=51156 RepID=UPI0026DBE46C|nr:uncharacterized protein ONS95_003785 [Cadophora gregata]KAK0107076.1 hypothetical protein ONS95_003785 [Cadophora gregata]KAK0116763.1 hypothetical protein ONS96_012613 [Cadophora gregata f. sp. sojae]
MNRQVEGIDFGERSTCKDRTPTAKDHERYEPSSYGLLIAQQEHQKLREEIKAEFLGEEARKFHKSLTNAYKKTARREARLDLEDDNRRELLKLKSKLEAEMLGKKSEQIERLREELRNKDAKVKELEARLEASENYQRIRELEGTLAAMRQVIKSVKKNEPAHEAEDAEENNSSTEN